MKYFLTLFFCVITSLSFGQSLSLGLQLTPELNKRYISLDQSQLPFNADYGSLYANEGSLNNNEKYGFGVSTGLIASLKLGGRISLESGILYTNKNYITKTKFVTMVPDPLIPEEEIKVKTSYTYLQIPLSANIYFLKGDKINIFFTSGITSNLFLNTSTRSNVAGKSENYYKENFNTVVWGYKGGFGIDISIKEKNTLRVQPVVEYWFTPLTNIFVKENHHSFGLSFSYLFEVRKN